MLKIRPHKAEDIQYRVKWLNNPQANTYIGGLSRAKTAIREQREWFDSYKKDKRKNFFTIFWDEEPIGFMGLSNISPENKNADLFIMIGEDSYRGRGLGKKSVLWLLDYAFDKLSLHKVNLKVIEENESAVALYDSIGFNQEGRLIEETFNHGRFYNILSMAIFKDSYLEKYGN